jgi:dTDP-4-amino-4,6-dideoxygalactose transaminase
MTPIRIPLMRLTLPTAGVVTPYLQRIDQSRIYSNFGPLVREFEARLAARHRLPADSVVTVANATLGLTAALKAQNVKPGTFCLLPAWTFIASPLAAHAAGLVPYFVDVDAGSWAIQAESFADALASVPGEIGAVMPVAPFGQPIVTAEWDAFRARTGIPVVIDAAAGFDAVTVGEVPVVVSLHATKVLGIGEGGFVVSRDTDLIQRIQTFVAFGFYGTRDAQVMGFNAKMSEYHAAVGLAGLDAWPETRAALAGRAKAYRDAFGASNYLRLQQGFGETWVANTCVVELPAGSADALELHLAHHGIAARHWWSRGAHAHVATKAFPRMALPVTDRLAASTLGLPFHRDLTDEQIVSVARVASEFLTG